MASSSGREVLAYHGWGFDSGFWIPWRRRVGEQARFEAADRGYFGRPRAVGWRGEGSGPRIVLAHSMGLMHCPPEVLGRADLLVLFGAFEHFHPSPPGEAKRSRRRLARMRCRFDEEPAELLRSFHRGCGLAADGPGGEGLPRDLDAPRGGAVRLDRDLLRADLDRLDRERVDVDRLRSVPRVLLLHGADDRIVPSPLGAALGAAIADSARFFPFGGAGHGLPLTHLRECGRALAPWLEGPG